LVVVNMSATGWKEARTCSGRHRNNTLTQFSASPDLQNEFVGAAFVFGRIHWVRTTRMWMSCVAGSVETS
jgi:hypothetical protein